MAGPDRFPVCPGKKGIGKMITPRLISFVRLILRKKYCRGFYAKIRSLHDDTIMNRVDRVSYYPRV